MNASSDKNGGSLFASLENLFANQLPNGSDAFVFVTGSASCGKSVLISSLHLPSGSTNVITPQATIALDYTPLRNPHINTFAPLTTSGSETSGMSSSSAVTTSSQREVAHIWELGGGSLALADLVQVPITAQRLPSNVAILVLDLSKPGDICNTAIKWVSVLKKRADECLDRIKKAREKAGPNTSSSTSDTANEVTLKKAVQVRLRVGFAQRGGERINTPVISESEESIASKLPDHPDWDFIHSTGVVLPFQTIIVGSKWDEFRDLDAPKRRTVLAALRFIGLCTGAHVVCVSHKDRSTLSVFKSVVHHACFGSEMAPGLGADDAAAYPLCIPAGADSLASILSCINNGPSSSPTKALGINIIGKSNLSNINNSALTRSDLEGASVSAPKGDVPVFSARLEKISTLVKQYFQPTSTSASDLEDQRALATALASTSTSSGGGDSTTTGSINSEVVFSDEAATVFPEPRIDELRAKKAQALALLIAESKEKERRAAVEARAVLKGAKTSSESKL
jgi:hypothetical protein